MPTFVHPRREQLPPAAAAARRLNPGTLAKRAGLRVPTVSACEQSV